jgi:hypothetical protein
MRKNWKAPPRTGEASAPDGMTVEMNGFRPEPSVFNDAKVAAEAAPTKDGFCRRIFRPEPSAFDDARVTTDTTPTTPNPWLSMTQRSRRKPLLPKDDFCRRGFSPELVFEAAKGPGEGRPCNPEPASSMTQRSRLKPLLPKDDFCRRGFSPEPPSSIDEMVGMEAASTTPDLQFSTTQRVAAEAAPTVRTLSSRSRKGRRESRSYKHGCRNEFRMAHPFQ